MAFNSAENISYEAVNAILGELRERSASMQALFDEIKTEMNNITSSDRLTGNYANALKAEFDEKAQKFPAYIEKLNELIMTVEVAARTMKEHETTLAKNANIDG